MKQNLHKTLNFRMDYSASSAVVYLDPKSHCSCKNDNNMTKTTIIMTKLQVQDGDHDEQILNFFQIYHK